MGVLRATLGLTGWTALGSAVAFTIWTRKSKVHPIEQTDYIFGNTILARLNPNNTPVFHDACYRKVPLDQIKPELLGPGNEGKLVEKFCAGVWSRGAYSIQRRILSYTNRGPETAHQLWAKRDLENSSYNVGAEITDHFEIVSKTADSIFIRGGDSPRRAGVRENDGLMELVADVRQDEGVVEFGMKFVFFNGLAPPSTKDNPIPAPLQWLHARYAKALMETAIKNCML